MKLHAKFRVRRKSLFGGAILDAILAAVVLSAVAGAMMGAMGSYSDYKVAADARNQEETFRSVQQGLAAEGISAEVIAGNPLDTVDKSRMLESSIETVRPTGAREDFAGASIVQGLTTGMNARDGDRGTGFGHQIELSGATAVVNTVDTPVITPAGGNYSVATLDITITTTTPGAAIHYTLDGSEPTVASPLYSGVFSISSGTTTIRARAFRTGWIPSGIAQEDYTLQVKLDPPVLNYGGQIDYGWFPIADMATAAATNPAGTFYTYTTDGSLPNSGSPVYDFASPPIYALDTIPAQITMRAFHPDTTTWAPSDPVTTTFTPPPLPDVEFFREDGTTSPIFDWVEVNDGVNRIGLRLSDPSLAPYFDIRMIWLANGTPPDPTAASQAYSNLFLLPQADWGFPDTGFKAAAIWNNPNFGNPSGPILTRTLDLQPYVTATILFDGAPDPVTGARTNLLPVTVGDPATYDSLQWREQGGGAWQGPVASGGRIQPAPTGLTLGTTYEAEVIYTDPSVFVSVWPMTPFVMDWGVTEITLETSTPIAREIATTPGARSVTLPADFPINPFLWWEAVGAGGAGGFAYMRPPDAHTSPAPARGRRNARMSGGSGGGGGVFRTGSLAGVGAGSTVRFEVGSTSYWDGLGLDTLGRERVLVEASEILTWSVTSDNETRAPGIGVPGAVVPNGTPGLPILPLATDTSTTATGLFQMGGVSTGGSYGGLPGVRDFVFRNFNHSLDPSGSNSVTASDSPFPFSRFSAESPGHGNKLRNDGGRQNDGLNGGPRNADAAVWTQRVGTRVFWNGNPARRWNTWYYSAQASGGGGGAGMRLEDPSGNPWYSVNTSGDTPLTDGIDVADAGLRSFSRLEADYPGSNWLRWAVDSDIVRGMPEVTSGMGNAGNGYGAGGGGGAISHSTYNDWHRVTFGGPTFVSRVQGNGPFVGNGRTTELDPGNNGAVVLYW